MTRELEEYILTHIDPEDELLAAKTDINWSMKNCIRVISSNG